MLNGVARHNERVAAHDVVDIRTLLRQHVDARQVARGAGEILIELGPVDDEYRRPAERRELLGERAGLGLFHGGLVQYDELAFLLLGGQRGLEAELTDLLLQTEAMIAHDRTEDRRAAAELRRTQRALARAAGALLRPGLLGRAGDFAHALGLVRAGAALGELPIDDAREDVAPHDRQPEDLVGEIDIAGFLILEAGDFELHLRPPPAPVALL